MKIQDLYEQKGNTSVTGVMNTIRSIYQGLRVFTSPTLCHAHTAWNIDPNFPDDTIVLYGYDTTVVHSGLMHDGKLLSRYNGPASTVLLPSGNLKVTVGDGDEEEMEPVFSMSVGDFLETV